MRGSVLLRTAMAFSVLGLCVSASVTAEADDRLSITPPRIILNAQGQFDDIEGMFGLAVPSGYTLTEFDFVLYVDDTPIAFAESIDYCSVDDILFVGFDRTEVQAQLEDLGILGEDIPFNVVGWVMSESSSSTLIWDFDGTDLVEVLAPQQGPGGR